MVWDAPHAIDKVADVTLAFSPTIFPGALEGNIPMPPPGPTDVRALALAGPAPPIIPYDVSAWDFIILQALAPASSGIRFFAEFLDADGRAVTGPVMDMAPAQASLGPVVARCLGPKLLLWVLAATGTPTINFTLWGSNRRYAHDGPYTPDFQGTILGSGVAVGGGLVPYAGPAMMYARVSSGSGFSSFTLTSADYVGDLIEIASGFPANNVPNPQSPMPIWLPARTHVVSLAGPYISWAVIAA